MYSVGEIISKKRKEKHLSQKQLAELLGNEMGSKIRSKTISSWETDTSEPSVSTFYQLCKVLDITNMYESYFGSNPNDPLSSLNEEGIEKVMDFIGLLHATNLYEKSSSKIIDFCKYYNVYENAASAGTGNMLTDGPYTTVATTEKDHVPEGTDFGILISGDSMEPEFHNGQIAWVQKQDYLEHGEIGIFSLNGDAYIKKLQDDMEGLFLISLNHKYAPIAVGENDLLHTFGKVIGSCPKEQFAEFHK